MSHTTDQIEADLNQNRRAISDTMEELGRKLSPGQLLDEGLNLAKGQAGEFASALGKQVRDNPLPVLLIAGGVALLALNRNNHQSSSARSHALSAEDWDVEQRYRAVEQAGWSTVRAPGETEHAFHQRLRDAQAAALKLKQNAGEAMDSFRERVGKAVESLQHTATATRDRIGSAFSDAKHFAQDQARNVAAGAANAGRTAQHVYDENPLAVGAVMVGLGAVLGSTIPLSRQERDTLQGVADQAAQIGADLAERGAQKVQGLQQRAAETLQ